MDAWLVILVIVQVLNLLVYWWVGNVFFSQPRHNHPRIFWNPTARLLLGYGPLIMLALLVVLAFFVTRSPWWFLGLSFVALLACSQRPYSNFFR